MPGKTEEGKIKVQAATCKVCGDLYKFNAVVAKESTWYLCEACSVEKKENGIGGISDPFVDEAEACADICRVLHKFTIDSQVKILKGVKLMLGLEEAY